MGGGLVWERGRESGRGGRGVGMGEVVEEVLRDRGQIWREKGERREEREGRREEREGRGEGRREKGGEGDSYNMIPFLQT